MQICARVVNKVRQPSFRCCVLRNYSPRWHTLLCGYECKQKVATINGIRWLVEKITRLLRWIYTERFRTHANSASPFLTQYVRHKNVYQSEGKLVAARIWRKP